MRMRLLHGVVFVSLQVAVILPLEILPNETQIKTSGSDLALTCSIPRPINRTGSHPHLDWWDPEGVKIEATEGRVHVDRSEAFKLKLLISGLKTSDSGSYRCTLFWGEIKMEDTLLVQVQGDESSLDVGTDSSFEAGAGDDVILQCGSMPPTRSPPTWKFNHSVIISKSKSKKYQVDKKGNLVVRRVEPEDAGIYQCLANQGRSTGSRFVELRVLRAPENVRINVVNKMVEGLPLHIECQAEGSMPMKFEWLKEQILSEKVRAKIPVVRQNSTMWFQRMRADHEGRYFCRVSNSRGTVETPVDVKMMKLPVIKSFQQNRTTLEEAPMVADCEASGDPTPTVLWLRGNISAPGSGVVVKSSPPAIGSSKLVIPRAGPADEGNYVCLSSNEAGNQTRVLTISVESAPKLLCQREVVYGWPRSVPMFTCTSTGKPPPSIRWKRSGQSLAVIQGLYEVEVMNHSSGVTSSLKITIGDNQSYLFGTYTSVAQNKHGSTSAELKLLHAELPAMPHNVSISSENGTSVTLKVSTEECRPVISVWRVDYRDKESNSSETQRITMNGAEESQLTITGLKYGREYLVTVAAGNEMGFGEPVAILVTTSSPEVMLQGSFQLQQFNEEETNSTLNFEILSGCFGAALLVLCSLFLVYCLKKKQRLWGRIGRPTLSSGVRCYSWYNATSSAAKPKNKAENFTEDRADHLNESSDSRKEYASPELFHACLEDRDTSLTLLRTTSRRTASLKYSHADATLSPERVSIKTGTSALDYDVTDTCSGVYEEIPKSDSTAVSEILDEYHMEPNNGGDHFLVQRV